jgi:Ni/Co efflux regulator RcnB
LTRILLTLILGVFVAGPVWAQQADEQVDGAEVAEDTDLAAEEVTDETDAEVEVEEEFDETGLDEQGFSNEDDDFRPSEIIPTDQSIEFPTDI